MFVLSKNSIIQLDVISVNMPVISESPNDKFNSKGTKTSYETNITKFILSNFADEKLYFVFKHDDDEDK